MKSVHVSVPLELLQAGKVTRGRPDAHKVQKNPISP